MSRTTADIQYKLAELTSQCVKCGLCLPSCPTFQLTENEAASPRGRVTLGEHIIRSVKQNSKTISSIDHHIDDCLQCRACESACPAQVNVAEIISLSKAVRPATRARKITATLAKILQNRFLRRAFATNLRVLQRTGLVSLLSKCLPEVLQRGLRHALPVPKSTHLAEWHPAPGATRVVAIHTGCLYELHNAPVVLDLIQLLHAAGFNVWTPPGQNCCGALAYHNGQNIERLNRQNAAAFQAAITPGGTPEAILSLNTACGSHWHSHSPFSIPVRDATAFVAEHSQHVRFTPCHKRVFLHQPCSNQHGLKATDAHCQLLKQVPKLEIITEATPCCGAAGSYFLTHTNLSEQMGTQWANTVSHFQPDLVLIPNTGCAMQWQAHGGNIPQQHLISFLASLLDAPHTRHVQ